ncbi:DUF4003 family protein [Solibacillus sp. CAU 1738]|uniref:DUF4003 family protein n=1 Tax=Solibacillus sp. CAU 1738 TaxID=3140363 RepID=UPI003260EBF8
MEQIIQLYETNYKKIENYLSWTVDKRILIMLASFYTSRQEEVDVRAFQEVIDAIKEEAHWLSAPRTNSLLQYTYAMHFSKEEDKKAAIREVLQNHKVLRAEKFPNTTYTYIAALFFTAQNTEQQAKNARALYAEMRKQHKFLTSYDDVPVAVMLASDGESDALVRAITMRRYYDELREAKFSQGNQLQTLSQILTIPSTDYNDQLVPYIVKIKETLESNGIKIKTSMYTQLGFLALIGVDQQKIQELIALHEAFAKKKYFKWYKNEVLGIAIQQLLPTMDRSKFEMLSVVSLEMLLQMQYAIIATTVAVSVASTSSGGDGN